MLDPIHMSHILFMPSYCINVILTGEYSNQSKIQSQQIIITVRVCLKFISQGGVINILMEILYATIDNQISSILQVYHLCKSNSPALSHPGVGFPFETGSSFLFLWNFIQDPGIHQTFICLMKPQSNYISVCRPVLCEGMSPEIVDN